MLALQKAKGYIQFTLDPPRVDSGGVRHFEVMRVTYDSTLITPDRVREIVARVSQIQVEVIPP